MNIIIEKENPSEKAGGKLANLLEKNRDKAVLLMLSGGSAFSMLEHVDIKKLPKNLTLSVLDERYDKRSDVNNFKILSDIPFFKDSVQNSAHIIDTAVEDGESHEAHAKRFEKNIRSWKKENPNGIIIATMGIGGDGHTAGIIPFKDGEDEFSELFKNKDSWVISYNVGDKNEFPLRTTVTNSFLLDEVDHVIAYISGESKRDMLQNVLSEKGLRSEYPARIMHEMKDVTLVTDIEL